MGLLNEILCALLGVDKAKPVRRNPIRPPRAKPGSELAKAQRLSQKFHGNPNEVIELSNKERKLPKYVVALGEMPALGYEPRQGSVRANTLYVHESGDRGLLQSKSKNRPVLAADPKTGRPLIIPMKAPVKFSSSKGLVG